MNKRVRIGIGIICIVVIGILTVWGMTCGDAVARIGQYTMNEAQFKEYWMLSSMQYGDAENTMERTAQLYARNRIAAEEIAGTSYAVPDTKRSELTETEAENFNRSYDENIMLCHQYGMSREELIHAVVTSKLNILVAGQHLSMITEEYVRREKDAGNAQAYSTEKLLTIYEDYMAEQIASMKFVPLNREKLQTIIAPNSADILEKLRTIEPDWKEEDVYILLGLPDRYGMRSVVAEVMYTVDDTTEAVIAFWSEGTDVSLMDTVTRKTRSLRETVRGKELLDKLKQIRPDWSSVQIKYLLGMYDRIDTEGDFAELVYTVDDTTEAVIALRDTGTKIYLRNKTTHQTDPF